MSRDHLLGVFWPESPGEQARASLRQAIRFLRLCLGSERLPGRGDEVGVELAGLHCDALGFRRALDEGELETALSLYEGDLLPGFFMSDAPTAQRWLENERTYLRTRARRAACQLSEQAEGSDLESAARYARRALDLEPTHEPAARQLIRVLDAMGNRAGAVTAYEALTDTLREALDLEPAPETKELIERVREGGREASAAAEFGETSRPDSDSDAESPATRRQTAPNRVVVRPFENLTGDADLDVLGRMIVDWVSRGLSELRELDVVPATTPRADVRPEAGTIVSGRYYREDSKLLLHARLTDVANDRLLPGPEPVVVSADEPLAGLDEITRRITAVLAPALNPRATHVHHGARPPSFEVYRGYMEGLEAFIAGDWTEAADRLRRCAEAAPEYALPRIVLAIATWNLGRLPEASEIVTEAGALRDTVGRFERSVLDTVRAWLKGDWVAAREAVRLQAHMAPGSIPSFQVAEEARRLNHLHEARDVLLSLDPEQGELRGWIHYWVELATIHHLLGEHEAEVEVAERARRIHLDDSRARWLEIAALAGLGRIEELERHIEEALTLTGDRHPLPGRWLHDTARELRRHGHDDDAARTLDRALAWFEAHVDVESDPPLQRDFARALYDAERWGSAETILRRLVEEAAPGAVQAITGHHGHLRGHLDEGYLAAIAWHRGDEQELERERRRLEEMDRRFLYGADRLWIGILKMLEGDEAGAVAEIRRALSEGLPFGLHLHADPILAPLRQNPRFRALVRPRRVKHA